MVSMDHSFLDVVEHSRTIEQLHCEARGVSNMRSSQEYNYNGSCSRPMDCYNRSRVRSSLARVEMGPSKATPPIVPAPPPAPPIKGRLGTRKNPPGSGIRPWSSSWTVVLMTGNGGVRGPADPNPSEE
ncbi:hypothetical protein MTR67_001377 [Solanum verrucosum]|uniref:Uncharacterized protein n=1 Tax=Solanum verrucosum TaxID=315347 RepID=A0AAF0PNJ3_SOLVR|nr:hypothetical protein MTR67_001377 [Solanum verrucosum]